MLAHPDRDFDPGPSGNIAIVLTVFVTYFAAFVGAGSLFDLPTWILMITLGLISLLLAVPLSRFFFQGNHPWKVAIFFVIQLTLCGIIDYIGEGQFWLLFLPLASQAASALSRKALLAVCAAILVLFSLPLLSLSPAAVTQWILVFLSAMVFVLIFTEASVRNQQARREVERLAEELEDANQRLREYAAQAEELARSRERNRMAREIHDSLGHYLTVVNIQLEAAKALVEKHGWKDPAPELFAALEKAQNLTRDGLADVRRSVAALRAGPVGDKPFLEALRILMSEHQEAGLLVFLEVEGEVRPLSPAVELTIYRAAQEALTNVHKHARASRADLRIAYGEHAVRLEVADNGVGFDPEQEDGEKFGLRGIRERVELLQGRFEIIAQPEGGVRLSVELPLQESQA